MVSRYQASEIMTSRTCAGPYCWRAASASAEPLPRASRKTRQPVQNGKKDLLLRPVRAVAQFQDKGRHKAQVPFFRGRPEHGQVAAPPEVHAAEMRAIFRQIFQPGSKVFLYPAPCVCFRHGQGPVHKVLRRRRPGQHGNRLHAGFNHAGGQIGSRRLPGNAEKLLIRAVAIRFDKVGTPCPFRFRRPVLFRHPADTAIQPGGKRVVQRNAVQAVGQVPGAHILHELVERVVRPVMRGNDDDLPAPHEQRQRRLEQFRQVFHEGRFVDDDPPLLAAQVGRAVGKSKNLVPAGKVDAERLDFPLVPVPEDVLVDLPGHDLQLFRPFRAGVDIFPRHVLIERNIQHVHAVPPGRGGFQHVVQRLRPGQADTAGFFHHLDR